MNNVIVLYWPFFLIKVLQNCKIRCDKNAQELMESRGFGSMASKMQRHMSSVIIMYRVQSARETNEANGRVGGEE